MKANNCCKEAAQAPQRIVWIDLAKGIGILLVVFGHMFLPALSPFYSKQCLNSTVVSSFHMPLFFFLSGLCFSGREKPRAFLLKKVRTLFVPWIFCTVIWCLYKFAIGYIEGNLTAEFAKKVLLNMFLQKRQYAIWFLICLFILEIFFYFILKLCKSKPIPVLLIVAVILIAGIANIKTAGVQLYWEIDIIPQALPFFAAGFYLKKIKTDKLNISAPAGVAAALVLFAAGQVINYFNCKYFEPHYISLFGCGYCNFILFFAGAVCGISAVVLLCKTAAVRIKPVEYIGQNSIIFFALHQIIFDIIRKILSEYQVSDLMLYPIWFAAAVFAVLLLAGANLIIMKTPFCVLLGKKYIKEKQKHRSFL